MIMGIFDKLFKKKSDEFEADEYSQLELSQQQIPQMLEYGEHPDQGLPELYNPPTELAVETKVFYNFDKLEYRLKMRNKSQDMLGDLTINLRSQKSAIAELAESKRIVEMLEAEKSKVLKFKIKPKYKIGKTGIYGKIEFFDFKSKERKVMRLPPAFVEFDLPKIKSQRVDEDKWRQMSGGLESYEVETEVMEIAPNKLFEHFKRVLNTLGFYMLPPIENVNLYRGLARFFGLDSNGIKYLIETQVIGDRSNSKVLFRIWSKDTQNAITLAYKTIDLIERNIEIKKFIVEI